MRLFIPVAPMLVMMVSVCAAEEGFVRLFDGKILDGWEGNQKIFRIEDGAIVAGSAKDRIAHNEFLCTTKTFEQG